MERIVLNRSNALREFELLAADSGIFIEYVRFIRTNDKPNVLNWADFALRVELRVMLTCTIYDDSKGRFVDERSEDYIIPLVPDIYQTDSVIQLNHRIDNRIFTVGVNSEQRHFNRLSLEVSNAETLSEDYTMEFFVLKINL
jgi:hypothetical protein